MKDFSVWILIILLGTVLVQLFNIKLGIQKERNKRKNNKSYIEYNNYTVKKIMTDFEKYFYDILIELEDELNVKIHPQVNLASILNKKVNNYYVSELFRNIDFGVFNKDYDQLLFLIEINDKTHNSKSRMIRDKKVGKILEQARIPLIKFYSNYPNRKEYVKNRIKNEIIKTRVNNVNVQDLK